MAPNRLQIVAEGKELDIEDGSTNQEIFKVVLSNPNLAVITDPTGKSEKGTWTMLYDQGMIVETSLLRFYANFKYTLKSEFSSPHSLNNLEESSYDCFNSVCFQTMVGFV